MNVGFGTSSGLNPTFIASRSRLRWLGNGQRSDRSDQHTARNGNHAESEPVFAAPAGVLAVPVAMLAVADVVLAIRGSASRQMSVDSNDRHHS